MFCVFGYVDLKIRSKKAENETKESSGQNTEGNSIKDLYDPQEAQALKLYNECVERKVIIDDKVSPEAKKLLAGKYGIQEADFDRFFEKGKTAQKIKKQEDANNKLDASAKRERDLMSAEARKATVRGKEKYLSGLRQDLQKQISRIKELKGNVETSYFDQFFVPKHKDPTIAAAWYSAIGGTAVGLAQANKVMARNEKTDSMAANLREMSSAFYQHSLVSLRQEESQLKHLTERLQRIDEKLIDYSNPEEKLSLIVFKKYSLAYTEGHNIEAEISLSLKQAKILNNDAILDGSIRIDLQNTDGKIVASGIYNAPGHEKYYLNEVGFNVEREITVLCNPTENLTAGEDLKDLTLVAKPILLWLIEGKHYSDAQLQNAIKRYLKKHWISNTTSEIYEGTPELKDVSMAKTQRILDRMRNYDVVTRKLVEPGRYYRWDLK